MKLIDINENQSHMCSSTKLGRKKVLIMLSCCMDETLFLLKFETMLPTETYIAHLRQVCHNSKFAIFELLVSVAYPGILFGGGGVQQIQLRTEDRENGDLGAVVP